MSPLESQFELLKTQHSSATLRTLPNGASVVTLPDFPLPEGWSRPAATMRFVVPVGYPFANPDCFWADPDLRLATGAMPMNTNMQPLPETSEPLLWFSWHTAKWHPSRDTLTTYMFVILNRLREAR